MTTLGVIGPAQILMMSLIVIIPIILIFFIGYKIGQKSGYINRVEEEK